MVSIRCPFCGKVSEISKYEKKAIYSLQDHILEKHLDVAFEIIMKYNSDTVKEEIVKEFMWRYNYFTENKKEVSDE